MTFMLMWVVWYSILNISMKAITVSLIVNFRHYHFNFSSSITVFLNCPYTFIVFDWGCLLLLWTYDISQRTYKLLELIVVFQNEMINKFVLCPLLCLRWFFWSYLNLFEDILPYLFSFEPILIQLKFNSVTAIVLRL